MTTSRAIAVDEFINAIRSCCFATASVVNHHRVKDSEFESRCYRDLFRLVVGRKPTSDELRHMTGGSDMHAAPSPTDREIDVTIKKGNQ
jgi:hypothetical protein